MNIKTKDEALKFLDCLTEDFYRLEDGDWLPDRHSLDASRDVVQALREFIEENV